MIRASAKNHAYVAIVTDPDDYASVLNALEMNFGALSLDFRKKLAAKAFARTATYDAAISGWFAEALEIEHPAWRAFGGRLDDRHALWREPAPERRLLRHRRQAPGRRHRAPASGQAALLQQHQRHRRRLRTGRRVRSGALRRRRHHQARQPLRRRRGRVADGGLCQGAGLRPGLGLRRHRRHEPPPRRRGRRRDRQDLHRGHHRARRHARRRRRSSRRRRICACWSPAACPIRAPPAPPSNPLPADCSCSRATMRWSTTSS